MRVRGTLTAAALAIAVGSTAAAAGVRYLLRRPLPQIEGNVTVQGISSPAEIVRDRWGVPHIYASNQHDVMFAVGYAQAQDRLWQMELNRRIGGGTLSEVFGAPLLQVDRTVRRVGFHRQAELDWVDMTPEERETLDAFTRGVNSYIASCALPVEFTLLRFRPQPWRPVDTLAYGRFMSWTLAGNWDAEIIRSWTIQKFGVQTMLDLEPGYPEGSPLIVPPGTEAKGSPPDLSADYRSVAEMLGAVGPAMSNNWAVDGEKSVTGKPLLANDPHLPLLLPSIWWEMHVDCPELKAAGVGLPGTPCLMIGHNDRIAWGVTAAIVDGDDLFVERLDPKEPSSYEFCGGWEAGRIIREEIRVRGRKEPVIEEVLLTRHGPVISPAIVGEERPLALRTTALEPSHQLKAQLDLMKAKDWDGFREALTGWSVPPLNFAYADVEGNIGYQLAGLVPIRKNGFGVAPMPGWSGNYEWQGFIPPTELPSAFKPETHWVASANNKITSDDYPHFLSAGYADGARQQRIIEMLEAREKLSVEDFKSMQGDLLSVPARNLAPRILQLEPADEWERRALVFLRAWNYEVSAESVAATVFEVFYAHLVRRALIQKVGDWSEMYLGRGIHPLRPDSMFFYTSYSWLEHKMKEQPQWFGEKTWRQAMEASLSEAVSELRERLGDEVSEWTWGKLHTLTLRHPIGRKRGLDRIFNRGPLPLGGDANTVCASAYSAHHGYDAVNFGVSWRQIIDLADFNRSLGSLPSGQSGHPGSAHYDDMVRKWRDIEYHPMLWDRNEVLKHKEGRLELRPGLDRMTSDYEERTHEEKDDTRYRPGRKKGAGESRL